MKKIANRIRSLTNRFIKRTVWYDNLWDGALKIINLNTFGLQVVNTGSGSGVHNFCYDGLPIKGFNFALGPQSLVHDFNILKNYFSYFEKGCTIFIPICPFSGMVVKYDKAHNFKYYPMLHPATIDNFDETERNLAYKTLNDPLGTLSLACIKGILRADILHRFKSVIHKTHKPSIKQSADEMMRGWLKQFSIGDLKDSISDVHGQDLKKRKVVLGEMLDFCTERGFRPIVVIPPMHPLLSEQFPRTFETQYMDPMKEEANLRGVLCIDYMRDNRFFNDSLYETALFLNKEGAKLFTRQILSDVKIIL
ncbi:hypothetical protein [Segatella bryantii]|uniref:hypothetical protein n=1 Tax=Segatella bryantii TaxID=77095 RepID=UPI002479603D|nr:hypothetical protein [Segatella bryantii]